MVQYFTMRHIGVISAAIAIIFIFVGHSHALTVGDVFKIVEKKGDIVYVYDSPSAAEEDQVIKQKNDDDGFKFLLREGRVFPVANGTKARVQIIRKNFVIGQILDGKYEGRRCLVLNRYVVTSGKKRAAPNAAGARKDTPGRPMVPREISVRARLYSAFAIVLPSDQTTGQRWQLAAPLDENHFELLLNRYESATSERVSVERWRFKAKGEGRAMIKLKYGPATPADAKPSAETVVRVDVVG